MDSDPSDQDLAMATRLHARLEIASAEIRTLAALSLQPRACAIINISKIDLECASTRLASQPDSLELEHIGRWLEMVESQLRTVRRGLTAFGTVAPDVARTA